MVTTYPDPSTAREFLSQAETFFSDASSQDNSNESRALLTHQAAVAACDAVLTFEGQRIAGVDGGHDLRLATARTALGGDLIELFERLDESKSWRNDASYRAQVVPAAILADALEATGELIELVRVHVV
ncbi:hypothetical protein [Baekduia sp. Peel2402]|uniref:hypothetical protein n=1 Tax=Baekduia sp. Peel2402 TaxID=3458296 RepID=UPI00403ED427